MLLVPAWTRAGRWMDCQNVAAYWSKKGVLVKSSPLTYQAGV